MISALHVKEGHQTLSIKWSNGEESCISAKYLRRNAQDAVAKRARFDGKAIPVSQELKITDINLLGHASLNIQFSDGHDRAIYPFSYLRELSEHDDNKLTFSDRGSPQAGN